MWPYNRSWIIALVLLVARTSAQSCTDPLPMPPQSNEDRDTSGLRPLQSPPIPVGGSLQYQCPQTKSIKGKNSFKVKCNDRQQYVFPPELSSWGECQCGNGDLTSQCPGLAYSNKYFRFTRITILSTGKKIDYFGSLDIGLERTFLTYSLNRQAAGEYRRWVET